MPDVKRSALDSLPPARRKIITALKISGELAAEDIAGRVHTSPGAVRQQLIAMRGEGYLQTRALRDGPGRPKLLYRLTDEGEALFPSSSPEQFTAALEAAREMGPDILTEILRRMTRSFFERIRPRLAGQSPEAQLEAGMEILREQGFFPAARTLPGGRIQLTLFHCPFVETARRVPELCDSEMECFRLVAAAGDVTRIAHRLDGQASCTYLFRLSDALHVSPGVPVGSPG